MKDDETARRRREKVAQASYPVGFCKTPVATRFGPNRPSASPGRTPGSKNKPKSPLGDVELFNLILRHGAQSVRQTDPNGSVQVSRVEGIWATMFARVRTHNQ